MIYSLYQPDCTYRIWQDAVHRSLHQPVPRFLRKVCIAVILLLSMYAIKAYAAHVIPRAIRKPYEASVEKIAKRNHIDSDLLRAVITAESGYNPHAKSKAGAIGLMQVMPGTARRFGIKNVHLPRQNIRAGARYLSYLMDLFDGKLKLVIAAYNAGEGAVMKCGKKIPPFAETRAYVPKVMQLYKLYQRY